MTTFTNKLIKNFCSHYRQSSVVTVKLTNATLREDFAREEVDRPEPELVSFIDS